MTPTQVYVSAVYALVQMARCLVTWDMVWEATYSDKDMLQPVNAMEYGMPEDKKELPKGICELHQFRGDILTLGGMVVYKGWVVFPPCLCMMVLDALLGPRLPCRGE